MVDSFHLSTQSTSEVLSIGKNKAVLVWSSCLILRRCSWYFCLTFLFQEQKNLKARRVAQWLGEPGGGFLSQTVTWALRGREHSSVFYVFLQLWIIHVVEEPQRSNTATAPHCTRGWLIQRMLRAAGVLPSAGTGSAQHRNANTAALAPRGALHHVSWINPAWLGPGWDPAKRAMC